MSNSPSPKKEEEVTVVTPVVAPEANKKDEAATPSSDAKSDKK